MGLLYKTPDGMSPFVEELRVSYVDPTRARAVVRKTGLFAGWDPVPRPAREWIRVERLGFIGERRAELNSSRGRAVDETPGRTPEAGVHLGTRRRQNGLTAPVELSRQLSDPADAPPRLPGLAESTAFIQTHNTAPFHLLAPLDAPVMARTQRAALPTPADAPVVARTFLRSQNTAPTRLPVPADVPVAAQTQRAAQRAVLPVPPRLHAQTTDLQALFVSPHPLPSPPFSPLIDLLSRRFLFSFEPLNRLLCFFF